MFTVSALEQYLEYQAKDKKEKNYLNNRNAIISILQQLCDELEIKNESDLLNLFYDSLVFCGIKTVKNLKKLNIKVLNKTRSETKLNIVIPRTLRSDVEYSLSRKKTSYDALIFILFLVYYCNYDNYRQKKPEAIRDFALEMKRFIPLLFNNNIAANIDSSNTEIEAYLRDIDEKFFLSKSKMKVAQWFEKLNVYENGSNESINKTRSKWSDHTQQVASDVLSNTNEQKKTVIDQANKEAYEIIGKAKVQAQEMIINADEKAQIIISRANETSKGIIEKAKGESAIIKKDAELYRQEQENAVSLREEIFKTNKKGFFADKDKTVTDSCEVITGLLKSLTRDVNTFQRDIQEVEREKIFRELDELYELIWTNLQYLNKQTGDEKLIFKIKNNIISYLEKIEEILAIYQIEKIPFNPGNQFNRRTDEPVEASENFNPREAIVVELQAVGFQEIQADGRIRVLKKQKVTVKN